MNTEKLTMNALFGQLGLPSGDGDILDFFHKHPPLPETAKLHELPIWNPAQIAFLKQAIAEDSEWCTLADELDARLRKGGP